MSEEMSERETMPIPRRGAWVRDEGNWIYTARPERYDPEDMHIIPQHITKGDSVSHAFSA